MIDMYHQELKTEGQSHKNEQKDLESELGPFFKSTNMYTSTVVNDNDIAVFLRSFVALS